MAEYAVTITEQDILNSGTYISIDVKERFTRAIAQVCLEPVEIKNGEDSLPMMVRENRKLKAQYLMGTLATLLRKTYTPQKLANDGQEMTGCMEESEYNAWAGSHVMNQLERLKKCRNSEVVNRLFDLLYEYKAIEILLNGAIRDELEARNDPLNRAMEWFTLSAADAGVKAAVEMAMKEAVQNG